MKNFKYYGILFLVIFCTLGAMAQTSPDARAAFTRLLVAQDPDILDALKQNAFVCFADDSPAWVSSDRFLIVYPATYYDTLWSPARSTLDAYAGDDVFVKQFGESNVEVWEHEDNVEWAVFGFAERAQWTSVGHYTRVDNDWKWQSSSIAAPTFTSHIGGKSITQDRSGYLATMTYRNAAKGTTTWSLSLRLSTGRYVETWEHGDTQESIGRCQQMKTLKAVTNARQRVGDARRHACESSGGTYHEGVYPNWSCQ